MSRIDWQKDRRAGQARRIAADARLEEAKATVQLRKDVRAAALADGTIPPAQSRERFLRARFRSACYLCGGVVMAGETCRFDTGLRKVRHLGCLPG